MTDKEMLLAYVMALPNDVTILMNKVSWDESTDSQWIESQRIREEGAMFYCKEKNTLYFGDEE